MKFSTETTEAVLTAVRSGRTLEGAAASGGISSRTLRLWLTRGFAEEAGAYAEFALAYQVAASSIESALLEAITRAADGDWRAAAWLLERRYPRRWNASVQQHVESVIQALDGFTARVAKELPPEVSMKVLRAGVEALNEHVGESL